MRISTENLDKKEQVVATNRCNAHLKTLSPVVLAEIKKIEIEKSQSQQSLQSAQSLNNHKVCLFTTEAKKICQRWSDESKLTFAEDVLPVVEFFLINIFVRIREQVISETCFSRQKTLLDLTDRILKCVKNPVGLDYIQARLIYYKSLMYLIQKKNEVGTICTYLQEFTMFSYDSPSEKCTQIDMLNTLCVACTNWMSSSEWECKVQNKISVIANQMIHKMIDIYDEIQFPLTDCGWDPAYLYMNLVARVVGFNLSHFLEICHDPRKESAYRHRMEILMTRLQSLIGKNSHLALPEKEYQPTFNMIIDFLKALNSTNSWLQKSMIKIAECLILQIRNESQALAYRAEIAALRKSVMEKSSDQKMKPSSPAKRTDLLQEENVNLQRQLQEINRASKEQQGDLLAKNKILYQRLKKGMKEKSDFESVLKSKDIQIQSLIQKNTQLKTQLTELKDQETAFQQNQKNQILTELQQITAVKEQKTAEYKQQQSKWAQRLREQQMALHSVSAEKRRLETEMTSSQSNVQQLREKLDQTRTQLTETQEHIERQASDKARDQTETYQTIQALQGEIERLRRLLPIQTSSMRGDKLFTFS